MPGRATCANSRTSSSAFASRVAAAPDEPASPDLLRELVPELASDAAVVSGPVGRTSLAVQRADSEREHILRVLGECGGDRQAACDRLGIGRTTLWRKLARPAAG